MPFAYDLSGTLLDRRYRIIKLLGKGGMGHVYDAEHVGLQQRVAIKVLHPRFAHEERFRERFIREARSASRIHHRNVVRISDFGETPDGSVYFAMEFLKGHDIGAELKKSGAMAWPRARHILRQIVGALEAAHAKSIIHRDIKPANCFLTEDEEEGIVDFVKVLDFGIAKVGDDSHRDAQGKGLTGTGEVFGTATYMSPEQACGNKLDHRSDLYSLGVMAYEMLVGQVPFRGINSIHVITRHLQDAPEPLRKSKPEIPADVEALVLKTLAKKREDRFASMTELGKALDAISDASRGPKARPRDPSRSTLVWEGNAKSAVEQPPAGRGGKGDAKSAPAAQGGVAAGKAVATSAAQTEVVSPSLMRDLRAEFGKQPRAKGAGVPVGRSQSPSESLPTARNERPPRSSLKPPGAAARAQGAPARAPGAVGRAPGAVGQAQGAPARASGAPARAPVAAARAPVAAARSPAAPIRRSHAAPVPASAVPAGGRPGSVPAPVAPAGGQPGSVPTPSAAGRPAPPRAIRSRGGPAGQATPMSAYAGAATSGNAPASSQHMGSKPHITPGISSESSGPPATVNVSRAGLRSLPPMAASSSSAPGYGAATSSQTAGTPAGAVVPPQSHRMMPAGYPAGSADPSGELLPVGAGSSPNHSAQNVPPAQGANPLPGRVDPSTPPPGRVDPSTPPPGSADPSVPPFSSWSSASTGPYATRRGDSSAETSPHALEPAEPSSRISGGMLLVVGVLVLLVGGVSAVGTMWFLGTQTEGGEGVAREDGEEAGDEGSLGVKSDASVRDSVEDAGASGGSASSPAPISGEQPGGDPEQSDKDEQIAQGDSKAQAATKLGEQAESDTPSSPEPGSDDGDLVIEDDPAESTATSGSNEEETNPNAAPADSTPPVSVPSDPPATSSPSRPLHETTSCAERRESAQTASKSRNWRHVVKATSKRNCWPSAEQEERLRLKVWALLELGEFAKCIKTGRSAKNKQIKTMVKSCEKKQAL